MLVPSHRFVRNRLLSSLPVDDYEALRGALQPIRLARGDILVRPDLPIEHVTFVEAGIVSALANTPDGRRIEVGLVGSEGFVGMPVLLGVGRTPHESFVQAEGEALQMTSATFLESIRRYPDMTRVLLHYAHVFLVQTAQTALSNGRYSLEERLARWLLMRHDRTEGDEFPVTHEFMSIMLGVRRPGVTTTVHVLEGAGIIKARRSRIQIVDRDKLEAVAGRSYGIAEAEYRRVFASRRHVD